MKILLAGASSYLGVRIYFDLFKKFDALGTYSSNPLSKHFVKLDITKSEEVKKVIDDYKPNIIIHAANNANARWCEANPRAAIELNQKSTAYFVAAANAHKAKLIYISSFAAITPTNVYAKTKFESEKIVKKARGEYLILRPSLILGFSPNTTNDRPFNRLLKNLDQGTPAVYDTSWKFQPTYVRHISEVIESCITKNIWKQTIAIAVKDLKSRFDTAKDILSPFSIRVSPINNHDTTPNTPDDLAKLKELNLPQYTYSQMIKEIIKEIKSREKFKL